MWLLEGIKAADDDRLPCSLFPTFCPRQEYKRLETLRQIKEADRRTEEMVARKEDMINQRRKAALEAWYGTVRASLESTSRHSEKANQTENIEWANRYSNVRRFRA